MKRRFILVAAFSAVVNILMLTGPMFMLQVYDRVLSSGSVATLQGLFVIVVVAFAFLGFYDFLRTRLLSRAGYRLDQDVSAEAFAIWMRAGAGRVRPEGRPLNDLSAVRGFVGSPAILGFFDLPWVPVYLGIVWLVHPWLGMLTLAGALLVLGLALANQALTRPSTAQAMVMDAAESGFVEQAHVNGDTILSLGMGDAILDRWRDMHRRGLATGQVGGDRGEAFTTSSKAFRLLLQSALLGLGGYLALQQEISAGMIVAASIIAGRALAPIDQVIGQWRGVIRAREAHRRLRATFRAQAARPASAMDLPEPKGHVILNGVTKFPPSPEPDIDAKPILSALSLRLQPGRALGVIGPSAGGKSTLARLLVGAWQPDQGEVRLDGATLTQWDPAQLGRHIGYLPQKLELLAGTVRDNIARFDPKATDEEVIAAARLANVHELILSLPDGYGTQIGYVTQPLSGGQIQRIGLARAVFGQPKLVVLDEPNSNLDIDGDTALTEAIETLKRNGSTVVVMAHRPSAIAAVDDILVLKNGQKVDYGPKAEVLGRMNAQQAARAAQAQVRTEAAHG
nr:type I secretion system permease/ATPase [Thalassococcus arenae]